MSADPALSLTGLALTAVQVMNPFRVPALRKHHTLVLSEKFLPFLFVLDGP